MLNTKVLLEAPDLLNERFEQCTVKMILDDEGGANYQPMCF